jgi:hypothetical protein
MTTKEFEKEIKEARRVYFDETHPDAYNIEAYRKVFKQIYVIYPELWSEIGKAFIKKGINQPFLDEERAAVLKASAAWNELNEIWEKYEPAVIYTSLV